MVGQASRSLGGMKYLILPKVGGGKTARVWNWVIVRVHL